MKKYPVITVFVALLFFSCNRKNNENEKGLITKRIQYDVTIVSPDPEYDWWVQNIEGQNREKMVRAILQAATSGKVKAYDFFSLKELSVVDVQSILRRVDTISFEQSEPPYALQDTVVIREVRTQDISRIRFLEEWIMNEESLVFGKKVAGICPLVEVFNETGESRGFKPLFWVFLDERFPGEMR